MPTKRTSSSTPRTRVGPGDESAQVDALLAAWKHPAKPTLEAVRKLIVRADRSIAEGVKWNSSSFRTSEWFATFHLRAKTGVQLILHLGAKKRADAKLELPDPKKLLTWLGKDRASVSFADPSDVRAKKAAFVALIRAWIRSV